MLKPTATTKPNPLLVALDQEIGFENRINSRISNIRRGYDEKTGEYVVWLEYRTRVQPGVKDKTRYPLMREVAGL